MFDGFRFSLLVFGAFAAVVFGASCLLALRNADRRIREVEKELLGAHAQVAAHRDALTATRERETYWRERAEKFIDQIALRHGMISTPTMSEEAAAPTSKLDQVFSALGKGEIGEAQRSAGYRPSAVNLDAAADLTRNV